MKLAHIQKQSKGGGEHWHRITTVVFVVLLSVTLASALFFVFQARKISYTQQEVVTDMVSIGTQKTDNQFPIGVNPRLEEINENPVVSAYFDEHVSKITDSRDTHTSWVPKILGKLALMNVYQNLASLSSRVLVIQSGERKEQIASHFAKILHWSEQQEREFLNIIEETAPVLSEGKFFPGTYTVAKGALPTDVAPLILDRFTTEVLSRYGAGVESIVPLQDTLIIASLIEREAYDFEDMRHISGVIWNRLFVDMRLQIDATLQYVKGSKPSQPWWPKVVPSDKYLASVYNTYKNGGLPPAPIANPSLESVLAALNPTKTDCMYYFHDKKAGFHCSRTYEEHVSLLKQYYGRGK